ncbi:hypothetical protein D3C77_383590 [compost metagenome]
MGVVEIGGFGRRGRLDSGLAQWPRVGNMIPALRQAFDKPTSETPISLAMMRTGRSHTISNSC